MRGRHPFLTSMMDNCNDGVLLSFYVKCKNGPKLLVCCKLFEKKKELCEKCPEFSEGWGGGDKLVWAGRFEGWAD